MSELRDFLYMDTSRLHSFSSQIYGGLANEITEKTRQTKSFTGGVNTALKAEGNREDESEHQHTFQLTDAARFSDLYAYLEGQTIKVNENSVTLQEGQFIEFVGVGYPPIIESWFKKMKSLVELIDKLAPLVLQSLPSQQRRNQKNKYSKQQMQTYMQMVDGIERLINLTRTNTEIQYIKVPIEGSPIVAWCGLIPEFIIVPVSSLPARVRVFGRVEKTLKEDESWTVADLSHFDNIGGKGETKKLIEVLNDMSPITKTSISLDDLTAKSPDFLVNPIAIYR